MKSKYEHLDLHVSILYNLFCGSAHESRTQNRDYITIDYFALVYNKIVFLQNNLASVPPTRYQYPLILAHPYILLPNQKLQFLFLSSISRVG